MGDVLGYIASPFLLKGALLAVQIASLAMVLRLLMGVGLALMRLSRFAPLRSFAWFYIWFVRGTPLLLHLVFIYDVLPAIGLKLDTLSTAVIGFALNEAAFSAELIRCGVVSGSRAQGLAAAALGMSPFLTLRRIIMPQAMRAILPGIGNQAISMIKGTSIASVIFVNELTFRAEQVVGQNFQFFTVFAAAGAIYLAMTNFVALAQLGAERRFDFLRDRTGSAWRPWFLARRTSPLALTPLRRSVTRAPGALAALIADVCRDVGDTSNQPFVVCRNVQKSYGDSRRHFPSN